jgi:hypothetical protein
MSAPPLTRHHYLAEMVAESQQDTTLEGDKGKRVSLHKELQSRVKYMRANNKYNLSYTI